MAAIELSLFDWRDVDARSDLDRFYLVRDHLPDAPFRQYLEVMRGKGHDDYPGPRVACGLGCPREGVVETRSQWYVATTRFRRRPRGNSCASGPPDHDLAR